MLFLFSSEDAPRKKAASQEDTSATSIHAMELEFFSNHTFATVAGLGEGTVLRGKWDVIGNKRDQLWMQVWRFGFGRSVSGSVYRYVLCVCVEMCVLAIYITWRM